MSYRRHRDQVEDWLLWVRKNRETLERCGVPNEAYATRLDWALFLDHGYVQSKSKRMDEWWKVDYLSPEAAAALRDLIIDEYDQTYAYLCECLDRIAQGRAGRRCCFV